MNIFDTIKVSENVFARVGITTVILAAMLGFTACAGDGQVIADFENVTEMNSVALIDAPAYSGGTHEGDETVEGHATPDGMIELNETSDDSFIYIYVCGAVCNPGVVMLPEGSRAIDALEAAGGFDDGANTVYVNLAGVLADGQRVYIPYVDEDMNSVFEEQTQVGNGAESAGTGLVNINTADVVTLCTIPGIGETRANAIIEYRNSYGPFEQIEDITKVSGIGEASFKKLSAYICVK